MRPIRAHGSADPSVFPESIYPPPRTSRISSTNKARYRGQPHTRAETSQGRYGAAGSPRHHFHQFMTGDFFSYGLYSVARRAPCQSTTQRIVTLIYRSNSISKKVLPAQWLDSRSVNPKSVLCGQWARTAGYLLCSTEYYYYLVGAGFCAVVRTN